VVKSERGERRKENRPFKLWINEEVDKTIDAALDDMEFAVGDVKEEVLGTFNTDGIKRILDAEGKTIDHRPVETGDGVEKVVFNDRWSEKGRNSFDVLKDPKHLSYPVHRYPRTRL